MSLAFRCEMTVSSHKIGDSSKFSPRAETSLQDSQNFITGSTDNSSGGSVKSAWVENQKEIGPIWLAWESVSERSFCYPPKTTRERIDSKGVLCSFHRQTDWVEAMTADIDSVLNSASHARCKCRTLRLKVSEEHEVSILRGYWFKVAQKGALWNGQIKAQIWIPLKCCQGVLQSMLSAKPS